MLNAKLLFESSPWFIFVCCLVGAIYAFVLYQKEGPWSPKTNKILAGLRFLLASILCFLLLGPFLRQIKNTVEKPAIVFALDNSSSISSMVDSQQINQVLQRIEGIKQKVTAQNYASSYQSLSNKDPELSVESIVFEHPSTDLDGLLKNLQADYEGRKLAGVVLLSDGIYNQGVSPTFSPYNFPIYTVGLGDTIPKADVNVNAIYYNKIAYEGNRFPILAEITSNGFNGKTVNIKVNQGGETLTSNQITFNEDNTLNEIELLVPANNQGLQHYRVIVEPIEGEFTIENNHQDAYIDIIEGKEKILIVAKSPHPDIKMIKNAISKNENYEVSVHIPGMTLFEGKDKYDLVIFHQIPDLSKTAQKLMEDFLAEGVATWFIAGSATDLDYLNRINGVLEVEKRGRQTDRVTPIFNPDYQRFIYADDNKAKVNEYPPMIVPYGNIRLNANSQIVLFQRVGSINTGKPLLAINNDESKKRAILLGEGLWQWQLMEYANHESHNAFDDLITKMVQYLSSKEDKRKFKVYPINNELYDTETVVFENEIYNNIYERIYNHEIKLVITDESGATQNFSYNISQNNSKYRVTGLTQGIYKYIATANVDGKNETSAGEFTVKALQIEELNLTANHQLLRALSIQNGGKFYKTNELDELGEDLAGQDVQGLIRTSEAYLPIINLPWIFFLILIIVSVEWFTRKYNGGY